MQIIAIRYTRKTDDGNKAKLYVLPKPLTVENIEIYRKNVSFNAKKLFNFEIDLTIKEN
jgi:hypothetical protein